MNENDLAGIRNARPAACFSPVFSLPRRSSSAAVALAATLVLGPGVARGNSSEAWPQPKSARVLDASAELHLLRDGCEKGDGVMCNDLGVSYLHGAGTPPDVTLALHAFERSCRQGSADGCGNLGALYESGVGVAASLAQAARLYDRACTMGCALACSNLGALYARGLGVERDRDEAQHLFTLACETGSAAGCNNLFQLGPAVP